MTDRKIGTGSEPPTHTAHALKRRGNRIEKSMLDAGSLPVEELAVLARREGIRPRPIYQAHKWFARRFGTAFRALLTAFALPEGAEFWRAYYEGVDLSDRTVLDPFVGGGTSLVEALRLGAAVTGVDVDPVACAITTFELRAADTGDLRSALQQLKLTVGERLTPYYRTKLDNDTTANVLHFFWVQVVPCGTCGQSLEAHPHYQLAYDAEHGSTQWVFCPHCHTVAEAAAGETELECSGCGARSDVQQGNVYFGRITCGRCGTTERLIDVASRTGKPPQWRLFALEWLEPAGLTNGHAVPLRLPSVAGSRGGKDHRGDRIRVGDHQGM
jgi:adenine-specific DNA methylase